MALRKGGPLLRAVIILASLTLLAGCVTTGPEEVTSASTEDSPAPTPAESLSIDEATGMTSVERAYPFSFDGNTGMWFCAPRGPSSCSWLPAGTGSEHTFEPLVYEGTPMGAEATLSWMSTTPATQEMYIVIFAMRSCGDGCFESDGEGAFYYATGPSPLTLSASGITLREGEALAMHVGLHDPLPETPLFFSYSLEQAFHLEGSVTALSTPMH